jgi:hypothetical protein
MAILKLIMAKILMRARQSWPFLLVIFLLLVVYWPGLTAIYGIHTDYSLLFKYKQSWFGFIETDQLFQVGRPLNGIASNIIFNTVNSIESFILWRWIAFGFMAWFLFIFWGYLRFNCKVHGFLASMVITLIGLTPAVAIYGLWVSLIFQGIPTVLMSTGAYFCLNRGRSGARWMRTDPAGIGWILTAALVFILALYLYPPVALAVFLFTFAHLVFVPLSQWVETRRRVIMDVSLFSIAIIVYRITERFWVTPFLIRNQPDHPLPACYDMAIGPNFFAKAHVLLETMNVSVAGPWHFFSPRYGWLIPAVFICSMMVFSLYARRHFLSFSFMHVKVTLERSFWVVLVLLLASLPVIMPKGVVELLGYRLVPVSCCMIILLFVAMLGWTFSLKKNIFFMRCAVVYVLLSAAIVSGAFSRVVSNYTRELDHVRSSLASEDISKKTLFVYIQLPPNTSFIRDALPYEYSLMITVYQHFVPLVTEALNSMGRSRESAYYQVLPSEYHGRVKPDPRLLVIDPQELQYWRKGQ